MTTGTLAVEAIQAEAMKTSRYHVEVTAGVPHEKPLPKRLHQIIQQRIVKQLGEHYGEQALAQLDILCNGDLRVPDIVVFEKNARFVNGMLADPPLLCVEIISPGQTLSDLFAKCEEYHRFGVPECWVIRPKDHVAWRYLQNGLLEMVETRLVFAPLVIELDRLFENLPNDAL